MNRNKQLMVNMLAQILAFAANMGINFFVTPYIVSRLGSEAYGFIGLSNNFVGYASLITVALNGMAGRFITVSVYQNKMDQASKYFNSVLWSNVVLSFVMAIPMIVCVIYLDKIVNVPPEFLTDVQCTFAIVFLNFIIGIISSTYSLAFFVKNKLYISSMRSIESNIIKIALIFILFFCLQPRISYIAAGALASGIFLFVTDLYYKRKLMPELTTDIKHFDLSKIKELLSLGIWNTLTKLSQILLSGLDLLIANLFVGSEAMGILAIAKTVPTALGNFMTTVVGVFSPQLTIDYAKEGTQRMLSNIFSSNRIMTFMLSIPIGLFIVYGDIFYSLWVPKENAYMLQILSVLTMGVILVSGHIQVLYQVFTITKKVWLNSIVMIITGALTTVTVMVLVKHTDLGIYAIAGVSTIYGIIRNVVFTPIYAARCLKQKWYIFYKSIGVGVLDVGAVMIIGYISRLLVDISNWMQLILTGGAVAVICLVMNFAFLLNKDEKHVVLDKLKRRK